MYYQPASGTNPPTLKLQTNGNAHLLLGLSSASATVFDLDSSGNLTIAGTLSAGNNSRLFSGGNDVHLQNANVSGWLYIDFSNRLELSGGAYFDASGNMTLGTLNSTSVNATNFYGYLNGNISGNANYANTAGALSGGISASSVGGGDLNNGVYASYALSSFWKIDESGSSGSQGFIFGRNSGQAVQSIVAIGTNGFGFKNGGGANKLAEMKVGGNFVIQGSTYYTVQSTINYTASGNFDAFDVAETYPVDQFYDGKQSSARRAKSSSSATTTTATPRVSSLLAGRSISAAVSSPRMKR